MVSTLPNDPVVKQPHPVNQITPVSKYLALALFVMLPFIGAYVGYHLAPEKVVEINTISVKSNNTNQATSTALGVETEIPHTNSLNDDEIITYECTSEVNPYPHRCYSFKSKTSKQVITNLTEEAKSQGIISGRTSIEELIYKTIDSNKLYFTAGIPESDACCRLISFDKNTLQFKIVNSYLGLGVSFGSKDNRYVATVENDTTLYILDLENEEVIRRKNIIAGSLMSSKCGFAGPVYNVTYSESKQRFDFSTYGLDTEPSNECEQIKISDGFISILSE